MRSYDEVYATARDEWPFSNGTEGFSWMENWCYAPCRNPAEVAWQRYEDGKRTTAPKDFPGGCPLIQVALMGRTPTEWLEQPLVNGLMVLGDQYHCIEFRGPDDGGGKPRPRREPPGMDGLFPRPERTLRMLKQPARERELVGARP